MIKTSKNILIVLAVLLLARLDVLHAAEPRGQSKSAANPKSSVSPAAAAKPAAKTDDFYTPEQDKAGITSVAPLDKSLPNVLILGDSISIGYTRQVRDALKGKANVMRPNANCGDTRMGLVSIDKWLGKNHWDVIHFNWGLWDLCYRDPKAKNLGHRDKVHGKLSTSLSDYEKNLDRLVLRLKRTGATLIWASSTVVPKGEAGRFVGDDAKYNAAAERVMIKHGVLIDDLYATTKAFPPTMFNKPGDVHYTPEGCAKLASQVSAKISDVLKNSTKTNQP